MGLLSFLKRTPSGRPQAAVSPEATDPVHQARTRARQRLVGSVVLVAAGVIGFPLLFETQPRQLPIDTPIEVMRKDAPAKVPAKPAARPALTAPAPTPAPAPAPSAPDVITERADESGKEVVAAASSTAAASQAASESTTAATKPAAAPKPVVVAAAKKPTSKPEAKPADVSRAPAAGEDKTPVASDAGRFVVQIGAFSESSAAREARQKADKLGLGVRVYTQEIDTSKGKRIRVRAGPFSSRDEAERVAGKLRASGMTSAVYTL